MPSPKERNSTSSVAAITGVTPATAQGRLTAALAICLWFGILAGIAERILYHFFPGTTGGNDLWYDALADLLFFAALSVPLLLAGLLGWRRYLSRVSFFFCSALFALDCLFVVWPPFGHRLGQMALLSGGALATAVLATALFLRFPARLLAWGRVTLPVLILYALLYLGGGAWRAHHEEAVRTAALHSRSGSPNVLLIIMDAVGANHLSTYGYERNTSPYLTELAARGVLFEKAVAPSSWTLPSHASMLTGRLPTEHHAGEYDWRLNGRFSTLAEAFQHDGYRTAGFSGNTFLFNRRVGLARGYIHFEDGSALQRLSQTTLGQRVESRLFRASLLHDHAGRQNAAEISQNALRWIQAGTQPFFATINYFDAHEPLLPPPAYFHRFSTLPSPLVAQYKWPEDVQLSPGEVKTEIDAYDASIAYIDAQISAFMQQLEAAGLLKNTIVIITSDHGQEFQEHGFMFHGKGLYWDLVHAPLIINWPGHLPAGERVVTPVALQSLPATLMTMVGAARDDPFPGPSLTPLWSKGAVDPVWPAPVSELAEMGASPRFPSYYGAMTSIVTPQWHYVEGGKSGQELYPCCGDEQHDLSGTTLGANISSAFRQVLRQPGPVTAQALQAALRQRILQAAMKPAQTTPTAARQKVSNRQRMNDQLHALGYVP